MHINVIMRRWFLLEMNILLSINAKNFEIETYAQRQTGMNMFSFELEKPVHIL